jgi:RNA polymerase sporulation-specific sigma factor
MARRYRKSGKYSKKNKKKDSVVEVLKNNKRQNVQALESEILEVAELSDVVDKDLPAHSRDMIEQILFKIPCVKNPLIGTPQEVQKDLDLLAKTMQKDPENNSIFNKIHLYMHGYLINIVLKKFPFIRGYQTVDVYQETLIALRFKAIPGFKMNKGMSFLNFAKMCIRRHLITLLNASKNRKKDQSINQAISLDSSPMKEDDDGNSTTYANIIADSKLTCDDTMEENEAYNVSKKTLFNALSDFEKVVLSEYLSSSSYREISKNITRILKKRYNTKSIDNALLRIRKKAIHLMKYGRIEDLPIFLPKSL